MGLLLYCRHMVSVTHTLPRDSGENSIEMSKHEAMLERIRARRALIDFAIIGHAQNGDRDDLQRIKGIGPFIEERCNALGIYTWKQISLMTPEIEEQVSQAIEFFVGRIQRDEWVKQAALLVE